MIHVFKSPSLTEQDILVIMSIDAAFSCVRMSCVVVCWLPGSIKSKAVSCLLALMLLSDLCPQSVAWQRWQLQECLTIKQQDVLPVDIEIVSVMNFQKKRIRPPSKFDQIPIDRLFENNWTLIFYFSNIWILTLKFNIFCRLLFSIKITLFELFSCAHFKF